MLLNLAGGDCVDDLRVLEGDEGCARVLRRIELHGRARKERRVLERRRAMPSPSAVFRYLQAFHDGEKVAKRVEGRAFIPSPAKALKGLYPTPLHTSRKIVIKTDATSISLLLEMEIAR